MASDKSFMFTEKPTLTKVSIVGKGHKESFYVAYSALETAEKIKTTFGWDENAARPRRGRPRKNANTTGTANIPIGVAD